MSGPRPSPGGDNKGPQQITILLVDDIPETRENIKKLLAFEADMKVVGGAGNGREGVEMAKELKPDIIIMDINMPDMDGLQATSLITKSVPQAAVIIMSVQDETDYMRRAMGAGARDFIAKPINIDDLTNTIRTVYRNHEAIRKQYQMAQFTTPDQAMKQAAKIEKTLGERAGRVIAVYSPQGGAGVTTIATSLATLLMNKGVRVMVADADLQFGDVAAFLDIKPQATIIELLPDADDLDPEHFDNIISTHGSGLKVLAAPLRPEMADVISKGRPGVYGQILDKVRRNYDYIVVDTSHALDDVAIGVFDIADIIVLVTTCGLTAVKNTGLVVDLFKQLGYGPDKVMLVTNKVYSERDRKNATLPVDKINSYLKMPVKVEIPIVDERTLLAATLRGVPITIAERDRSKPPVKQYADLSKLLIEALADEDDDLASLVEAKPEKKPGGLFRR